MNASTLMALLLNCAPQVHPLTAQALVQTESALNPWAIGVVGGQLARQPGNLAQALATADALRGRGVNFSVGLAQINVGNFDRLGLTLRTAFEPCANLAAMQRVLVDCYDRAPAGAMSAADTQTALRQALSCYYSGNFMTGFRHGYVGKVVRASTRQALPSRQGRPASLPVSLPATHPSKDS
jgi:type IV secretion system protein VirB1